jgi:hypothetical protein
MIARWLLINHAVGAQQRADVEWLYVSALNTGGDRIVAFDLKVSNGSIGSLPNIPKGWFISITNDPSGEPKSAATSRWVPPLWTPAIFTGLSASKDRIRRCHFPYQAGHYGDEGL